MLTSDKLLGPLIGRPASGEDGEGELLGSSPPGAAGLPLLLLPRPRFVRIERAFRLAGPSPEAILLIFALSFLVLAAAVAGAGGNRKMFLPREGAAAAAVSDDGGQATPTTAEEVAVGGEMHLLLRDDEEMLARRVDLQTEDYPGSGANGRHDPRNPH